MLKSFFEKRTVELQLVVVGHDLVYSEFGGVQFGAFLYLHHQQRNGVNGFRPVWSFSLAARQEQDSKENCMDGYSFHTEMNFRYVRKDNKKMSKS